MNQSAAKSKGLYCFFSNYPSWLIFLLVLRADRILLVALKCLLHHKLSLWHRSPANNLQAWAISTSVPLSKDEAHSHSWHFHLTQFSAWMLISTNNSKILIPCWTYMMTLQPLLLQLCTFQTQCACKIIRNHFASSEKLVRNQLLLHNWM